MSATNRYAFIARSLVYFFITTGALIAGFTYFEKERIVTERVTLQQRAASRMDLAAASIRQDFRHITAATLALSQSENLLDFLDAATPGNRSRVESEFLRWAAQERIYDQIRYIDEKGMERVRINADPGGARIVPTAQLQDKSNRYYFQESARLGKGEVFISPLDLNIENGKIERPLKPALRIATPVFDKHGRRRGIVILNYLAGEMLDRFRKQVGDKLGQSMLLDSNSYWLSSPDTADEWGNLLGHQRSFSARFPAAWSRIRMEDSGSFGNSDGHFTFTTVYPRKHVAPADAQAVGAQKGYFWKVVNRFPPESVASSVFTNLQKREDALVALAFVGVLSLPLAWLRTNNLRKRSALREAAAVFRSTTEAIIIADAEQNIVAVNKAFTDMTGYAPEEVIGKNPRLYKSGRQDEDYYREMWVALERTGHWRGEIWNRRKNGEIYPVWENISVLRDMGGKVIRYVAVLTDISSIKESEQRLEWMAHHDSLTNLPNRLLFGSRLGHGLEHSRRHGKRLALFFLDIDRFKFINDTMGHATGDRLLQIVAMRLNECIRGEDTVARLGGDEFTVILEELGEAHDAAKIAENLIEAVSTPMRIDGRDITVTTSIGISVYPDDADSVDSLVKAADTAMYLAKAQGKNNYQFYRRELTAEAVEYAMMESGLRQALARGELLLEYQPQVSVESGEIVGVEALLRWRHPELGLVLPERFIAVAEETGLIVPIGEWVLRTACAQVAAWEKEGLPPLSLAVNFSVRQLRNEHVLELVRKTLEVTEMRPEQLELCVEVTESILQTPEQCISVLNGLKRLGTLIAIDDFGTGYSSLSSLRDLPIDKLKIDRSFIRDIPENPQDEAIARAIIAMAHELGLHVIAEGVETRQQWSFLRTHRCDYAQGYLFSRSLGPEEMSRMLRQKPHEWLGRAAV